jgi:hypothetical protein
MTDDTITLAATPHKTGTLIGPIGRKYVFHCGCGRVRLLDQGRQYPEWLCKWCKKIHRDKETGRNCWVAIVRRCESESSSAYHKYGAKGIAVCDAWLHGRDGMSGFQAFMADMGPRPSHLHTVNRLDNEKGYEPGNCEWATQEQQSRNRRDNVFVTAFGKTKTIAEWSREVGMNRATLRDRLLRGWEPERALKPPR